MVYGVQPQPVVAVHVAKARAVGRPGAVKLDVSTGPRLGGGSMVLKIESDKLRDIDREWV